MRNRSWPAMPYPGLRPFDISADRDESVIFFGRKKQIYELIDRLATSRFIAVLGPSGCGKSSLIRAGVIPDLELGYLQRAGARWTSIVMEPGGHPIRALAISLQKALVEVVPDGKIPDQFTSEEIEQRLKHRPDALVTFFEDPEIAAVFGPDRNVLILVDQFEELFRPDMTAEKDAQHFINLMLNIYHDPPQRLYIILTMRTDFIKQSACYPGLPTVLSRTMCLLDKIDKMGLREAIAEPVKLKPYNGEISDDLTKWILDQMDTEGPYDPDLLPLMQHALLWGWQQTLHKTHPATEDKAQSEIKEKTVLRKEDFSAFTDLADCLSKHADTIFNGLAAEQQRIAEVMFRLLCDAMPDGTKIRRVTSVDEMADVADCRNSEDLRTVINAFMSNGAGFIRWKDEGRMIDVSHESFIRKWNRFNIWADREAKKANKYVELLSRAHHYQETGLLDRLALTYYSNWDNETKPTSAWAERYQFKHQNDKEPVTRFSDVQIYLNDSEVACREEENNKRESKRNRILITWGGSALLIMLLVFSIYSGLSSMSLSAKNLLDKASDKLILKDPKAAISLADDALKIDNLFRFVYVPILKSHFGMENISTGCHLVKAKSALFMADLASSLDEYESNILASFNEVASKDPTNNKAYELLIEMINIHLKSGIPDANKRAQGLYDKAIQQYKKVENDGDKGKGISMSIGEICLILNRLEEAKHFYEIAEKHDANNIIYRQKLSQIYIQLGNHTTAIAYLEKIIADDPHNRESCSTLLNEYIFEAIECLKDDKKAVAKSFLNKINMKYSCLTFNEQIRKAQILIGMQDQDALNAAIQALEDAIESQNKANIKDPEPFFLLASVYAQDNKYPEAIKNYREAITINKKDFRALRGLAYCMEKQGAYAEAAEMLKEAEMFEPWKPLAADTAAMNITTPR